MQTVLVTGSAGFIGFHLSKLLLEQGYQVVGLDALSNYYDVSLKEARHAILVRQKSQHAFIPVIGKLEETGLLMELFATHKPDYVVHLAGQAGVRYSIDNPRSYLESNIIGSFELLEAARAYPPAHMLLASTSSAYGANTQMPYTENQKADHQVSFYAATKKSIENMAHSYAHLFDLPVTMFRFFTVYGPWGRPDMAPSKFTKAVLSGEEIDVYNHGDMKRDFTYVSDIVEAIHLLFSAIPERPKNGVIATGDSLSPVAPYRVVNIGTSESVQLTDFIVAIERATGMKAQRNMMPMQPGDVSATWADTALLKQLTGYTPKTEVEVGVAQFVDWYRSFYRTNEAGREE